jgi:nickel transport system ATP-binding protein
MQNPRSAFNPLHTMATHARETCRAAGQPADDAALIAAMTAVGLENPSQLLKRYPFEMSGGMLQRMMIALALLSRRPLSSPMNPPPTSMPWRRAHSRSAGRDCLQPRPGLLLVTHDMGVVARLAHDVAVMENGRIVEQCDVNTLFSAPQHPVSQRLLAAHLALYGMEFAG